MVDPFTTAVERSGAVTSLPVEYVPWSSAAVSLSCEPSAVETWLKAQRRRTLAPFQSAGVPATTPVKAMP